MEPRIQYAQTEDGVSIAYCVMGEGPTLVFPSTAWGDVHMYSHNQDTRKVVDALVASGRRVVRYDGRGMGSSDRGKTDYSLEARLRDLDAVIERVGVQSFALCGYGNAGPVAIAYSVQRPERVTHLILVNSYASGSEYLKTIPAMRLTGEMRATAEEQWEFFLLTLATAVTGFKDSDLARKTAEVFREGMSAEAFLAFRDAVEETDVQDLLGRVTVPTLVVHDRPVHISSTDELRVLASRIPNAHFVASDDYVAAIDEFLGEGEKAAVGADAPAAGAVYTILFTDVEGSTALTQRLGDAEAREVLREHERIVREALNAHGGFEVKTMGDGFMASFSSATRALACAIAMQRAFAEWNAARPSTGSGRAEEIRVRIGLNAGEPIAEEEDLFGTAVIRAARIAAMAQGGEISAANVVRELAEGKGFLFADRGDVALRGFEDPVRLFEVRWREEG